MELYRVESLTFTYPGQFAPALRDVSLTLCAGEFVTLCGLSGSGKSTLLRQLKTALAPNGVRSGAVLFDGRPLSDVSQREQAERIGFVQQSPENQIVTDKVWHELAFGLESLGLSTPVIRRRVAEIASFFGIQNWFYKPVCELSGGQKQLVNLASVMALEPSVLLLDEPLGALDLRLRKDMQNELKNIQQRMGITFIYVTHDQEEALTMSDTIVVMNKGKIQQIGTPQDIYNEPKNAFVADFIGESNILDGVMLDDYLVKFFGRKFQCVDKGFEKNEPVDVVIRPEDIDIVPPEQGHLCGTVTSVTFKGVHYDTIVDFKGFKWLIQTTDYCPVDSYIGIRLNPEDIHIMHKSEYSGLYGDYSSYSAEYDEIADAQEEAEDEE